MQSFTIYYLPFSSSYTLFLVVATLTAFLYVFYNSSIISHYSSISAYAASHIQGRIYLLALSMILSLLYLPWGFLQCYQFYQLFIKRIKENHKFSICGYEERWSQIFIKWSLFGFMFFLCVYCVGLMFLGIFPTSVGNPIDDYIDPKNPGNHTDVPTGLIHIVSFNMCGLGTISIQLFYLFLCYNIQSDISKCELKCGCCRKMPFRLKTRYALAGILYVVATIGFFIAQQITDGPISLVCEFGLVILIAFHPILFWGLKDFCDLIKFFFGDIGDNEELPLR